MVIGKRSFATQPRRRSRLFVVGAALEQEVAATLGATFEITCLESWAALSEAGALPDAIACEWNDEALAWVERGPSSVVVIHVGVGIPPSLVDAVAAGHPVFHAADLAELADKVRALQPTRLATQRHPAFGLTIRHSGGERFDVLDLSSSGLAFELPQDRDVAPYLPGTVLEDIEVSNAGVTVLGEVAVRVQHVRPTRSGYHVGCEIRPRARQTAEMATLRDRAMISGVIQAAMNGSGLSIRDLASNRQLHAAGGLVDGDEIALPLVSHHLGLYQVVEARFEIGGQSHRFHSSVLSENPFRIGVPRVIEHVQHRASPRHRPGPDQPITARISSPFAGEPLTLSVEDISSVGLSVGVDPTMALLPLGTFLPVLSFDLGGSTFSCAGRVRNLSRRSDGRLRCGIEFAGLDDHQRERLADWVVRRHYAGLDDGRFVGFDELFAFFRQSGFLPPERERALEPTMTEVRRTFETLAGEPNRVFKSVVLRKEGAVVGHISSVRSYRRTYSIQHLAARAGRQAGLVLSVGNAEYLMQNLDFDYIKMWFHSSNPFPAKVFGGFARKILDPDLCVARAYAHVTLPTTQELETTSRIHVADAGNRDLLEVEQYFLAREPALLLRADDFTRSGLRLQELTAAYRALGLERRRDVLSARSEDGTLVGFVLAEISSPGLNLFDALSRYQVFVTPAGQGDAAAVRKCLIATTLKRYAAAGRTDASAVIPANEAAAYRDLGVPIDERQSVCLTCHRSQLRRFAEHMDGLFVRAPHRKRAGSVVQLASG